MRGADQSLFMLELQSRHRFCFVFSGFVLCFQEADQSLFMLELQSRHCFSFVFSGRSLLVDKRIDVLNRPTRKSCERCFYIITDKSNISLGMLKEYVYFNAIV